MQFPVPQFTEVEDRIIGPLTIKQFGIMFGAGAVVFLLYSATKSILVLVAGCLFVGLPALAVAFVPFNGRPIYNVIGQLIRFTLSPKFLVFHKEVYGLGKDIKLKDAQVEKMEPKKEAPDSNPQSRLAEVQKMLEKHAREEKELAGKIS